MKKSIISLYLLTISIAVLAQGTKPITLEDIWINGSIYPSTIGGFVNLNDGKTYCQLETDEYQNNVVNKYDYATGNQTGVLIDGKAIAQVNGMDHFSFGSFQLSADEQQALIPTQTKSIYRHSRESVYMLLNLKTNKLTKISEKHIRYATFNPPGTMVAYVLDNNLYVKDLIKGKTKQLTKDGKHNAIINGGVDWVYEEEFSMSRGFEWNADGTKLAYYRFDETKVPMFDMTMYGTLYPQHEQFKYPKAGEVNSTVDVYICNLKGKRKKLELNSERDQYIPRIKWTEDPNILSVQRLNRLQNHWELLMADASTGKLSLSIEEENKYYVDIHDDIIFLKDKRHFVMKSERTGYWHLYMHKIDGPQVFEITKGDWEVEHLLGVDEKNQKVYFTSTEVSPIERHVYVCDIDGKKRKRLTMEPGTHEATFSNDFSMFFHTHSAITIPFSYNIRKNDGTLLREIETNAEFAAKMSEFRMGTTEFREIEVENGVMLNAYMIYPKDFDPTKEYPLFMHVYGGPGSQQVLNSWRWSNFFWHHMLASEHNIIIAVVDNRGTGGRGEEFKKMTYKQLGKYETEDQIAAAKKLGELPFVNAQRMGIWGWSYGGYMSSLCLAKGSSTFKMAIAVAPVTNWRYYDNVYTERFMRTPQENAKGYDDNSPINHVSSIKGKYLIVHGLADDNVHFQNTAEMVNAMISKNIPFDSEFYPNKNHGIYGGYTRIHLFDKMTRFVEENL
ncbi:MAG: S9 family peptidase [Flavobacteriales bacterium]|nr:S9 family peptidase [Bacteroidota bacterium]MCB9239832.1 S9 family peptidase [Flavobacteriales bacterium]